MRWTVVVSWAMALAIHVALFAWLAAQPVHDDGVAPGAMDVVFVELAPTVVAPPAPETPPVEAPNKAKPEPAPVEPVEPATPPVEVVEIPTTSEPAGSVTAAAESESRVDTRPAAPPRASATRESHPTERSVGSPSPGAVTNEALARWQAALLAHLHRHHRYPYRARRLREEGVVQLRFAVNRAGELLRFDLAESSGHALLDQESLAMIQRAQPLPAPPSDVPGNAIEVIVPVTFELRRR